MSLVVIVPTVLIRDYLPILQKVIPPSSPEAPATGFYRRVEKWETKTTTIHHFVPLRFNGDIPLALSLEDARQLAADLVERAKEVEAMLQTAH